MTEPEPAVGRVTAAESARRSVTSVIALAAPTVTRGEFMFLLSRRM